ncbi:hypothetical protein HYW35_01915 [Candidatus Saccharibacteria bacterium]|nr:hypothetical protein [Candidatus Saccharibacteria bacterium]
MAERLTGQEFAEQLPKSAEFNKSRRLAISAVEVADATREQLETEVAAKNAELEEQGLVGSYVRFETTEEFTPTSLGLQYNFYGVTGSVRLQTIYGKFNGLTVLDTNGAYVRNMSGFKLQGIEPERFAVCASIECPATDTEGAGVSLVPLRGIETPLAPRTEFYDDIARASLERAVE